MVGHSAGPVRREAGYVRRKTWGRRRETGAKRQKTSFFYPYISDNVQSLVSLIHFQQCRVSPLSIIPTMSSFFFLYLSNKVEFLLAQYFYNNVEYFRSQCFQQCRVSQLLYRVSYLFCSMFAQAQIHQQKLQPNKSKWRKVREKNRLINQRKWKTIAQGNRKLTIFRGATIFQTITDDF